MASPPRRASPAAGDEAPAQHAGASEPQEPQDDDAAPQTPDDAAPQTPDDAAPRQQEGGPGTDSAKGHGDGDPRQDAPATPPRPGPRAAPPARDVRARAAPHPRQAGGLGALRRLLPDGGGPAPRAWLRQVQAQMVDKMGDKCEGRRAQAQRARGPRRRRRRAPRTPPTAPSPPPPHLLPPSHVLAAHLAAHLAPHRSLLNAKLQTNAGPETPCSPTPSPASAPSSTPCSPASTTPSPTVRGANQALGGLADELADEARAAAVDDGP
ncbi:hypothetical protein G6O67_003963 [Ophiocordyceps sinensis]|uniref:Uncharacterized protein n=1 Tax=Ophiocordyceps sinensis TaxID=72228 RepID=A0A8H4LYX8_9HYPO|nr:hypothetical protein G6O67_003963 [Ophiocordyceps sinensis]